VRRLTEPFGDSASERIVRDNRGCSQGKALRGIMACPGMVFGEVGLGLGCSFLDVFLLFVFPIPHQNDALIPTALP